MSLRVYTPIIVWGTAGGATKTLTASYVASDYVIPDHDSTTYGNLAAGVINCQGKTFLGLEVVASADAAAYIGLIVQVSPDLSVFSQIVDIAGAFDVWSVPKRSERAEANGGAWRLYEIGSARYARVMLALAGAAAETALVRGMLY